MCINMWNNCSILFHQPQNLYFYTKIIHLFNTFSHTFTQQTISIYNQFYPLFHKDYYNYKNNIMKGKV